MNQRDSRPRTVSIHLCRRTARWVAAQWRRTAPGPQPDRTPGAGDYRSLVPRGMAPGHVAVIQGLVWKALGLDETTSVAMSGYQLSAPLTTAAVRLGLVGAIEAQVQLQRCLSTIAVVSAQPVADDEPFRSFTPLPPAPCSLPRAALSGRWGEC